MFGGAGLAQLFEANEDQKQRYLFPTLRGEKHGFFGLTEPSGGSDPARAIQTTAVKDGGDWGVHGGGGCATFPFSTPDAAHEEEDMPRREADLPLEPAERG